MKKGFIVTFALGMLLSAAALTAVDDVLAEADALFEAEEYTRGLALLEDVLPSATTSHEKAEVYWRLAKFQLNVTDDLEDAGTDSETLLELFDLGSSYAEKAIELEPSPDAYFWHSSNIGRWGETKGILDSLFKAGPMRDDLLNIIALDPSYADAWYVLGRLYLLLPGWPLSFGNTTFAVSYARRSIDLYAKDDLKISYYKSLAEILWKRNWDTRKREREIRKFSSRIRTEKTEFDRMTYYEASLGTDYSPEYTWKKLGDMTDHEEARAITDWLLDEYAKISSPDRGERNGIQEVKDMVAEW